MGEAVISTEQSLADEPAPAAGTSPFGAPSPSTSADGGFVPGRSLDPPAVSIVDDMLDLDELLSADVRRAEKTARFFLEPDREARIDALNEELKLLTDDRGNPLPVPQGQVSAYDVAVALQTEQAAYGKSAKSVRMRQLPADEWDEFLTKHKATAGAETERPVEFWNELISLSAHNPPMPIEKIRRLRKVVGSPQMIVLGNAAWEVNVSSGVSIPKSQLSSHVLRRAAQGLS